MNINTLLDQTTVEAPDAYRKVTDYLLSKGLFISQYNAGVVAPRLPSGSPAPGGLSNLPRESVELGYRRPDEGKENVSIISQRGNSTDPNRAYAFQYTTTLTTYNFDQYVRWRTDALTALKPVKDIYEPFIDTFNVPEKDKVSVSVRITQSYSDDQLGYRHYTPTTVYTLVITRTVKN